MDTEIIVSSRPDREIRKKIIKPGDYTTVPYEDSRCKIVLTHIKCKNDNKECEIDSQSKIFSSLFDGNVLIGDLDNFIDKDFEILLQQMCCGEVCEASISYRDKEGKLAKEISFEVELKEVMEEQLVCDWSWQRLYESSIHHKECGVQLVKQKRIADAFRRFSKSLKMLVAVEPIDPKKIDEEQIKEMIDMKVKLYNNLAHCQLQFHEHEAAIDLCNRALNYQPDNIKALYRRCSAYTALNQLDLAWSDIQRVLSLDPEDKAAQQKANLLRPKIENINTNYKNVIKKMFG